VGEFVGHPYVIKVCGVTSVGDADLVVQCGATALGVILAQSPRQVGLEAAAEILASVDKRVARVAVLRDVDADDVRHVLRSLDLDAVQIHGGLRPSVAQVVASHSVALVEALSIDDLDARSDASDVYLIDGPRPGSGETHGWRGVTERTWNKPLIVAGGLSADNLAGVLDEVGPWGCDVATGSESSPGVKDRARVESFVRVARQYFDRREESRG
jgi:phosphoribosylanthranilate isomerase